METIIIPLHLNSLAVNFNFPIILGLTAAIAHVLMGPDHLAAVTPLVFDTQKRHWRIGLLWGIGHIIGMLLIGILFYFFKELIPVEAISTYSEQFVGVILIGLGIWAFYRMKNKKTNHKHLHFHDKEEKGSIIHIHEHKHEVKHHAHTHAKQIQQNDLAAILVGVFHGFAGIAHFVLLIPVLGFKSNYDSIQYIIGFAIGIIIAMIIYTVVIGRFAEKQSEHHDKPIYTKLQFWGGVLAIVVGVYWIVSNLN